MIERVCASEGVCWTVETAGVLVLPREGGEHLLTGLEAAAWDLLNRGESRPTAVRKLASIGKLAIADVEAAVDGWIESWRAAGWIVAGGARG